jgi:hypothetical protein
MSDFDAEGQWRGRCEECGTDHDGFPPGTLGGDLRCLRARAVTLGADHLVDQIDAMGSDLDSRAVDQLRAMGIIPP